MAFDNEGLVLLKEKTERKDYLTDKLRKLNSKRYEVRSQVLKLERFMESEKADLERLEKPGIASLFYNITGKYEAKHDQEYAEYRLANDKYNKAAQELALIDDEIARTEHEYRTIMNSEIEFAQAFNAKLDFITNAGLPLSVKIRSLDNQAKALKAEMKALDEAMRACRDVASNTKNIIYYSAQIAGTSSDSDEYQQYYGNLTILREALPSRSRNLKTAVEGVYEIVEKYDGLDYYKRFADRWFNRTISSKDHTFLKIYGTDCDAMEDRISKVYETVEKKYSSAYEEFEVMVINTDI
ncbi:MAG: hypothetical protein E7456_01120 [Ruminococcaceae bacterium]|nr:hypothetical protein [Oscillospiraceae bacterium]